MDIVSFYYFFYILFFKKSIQILAQIPSCKKKLPDEEANVPFHSYLVLLSFLEIILVTGYHLCVQPLLSELVCIWQCLILGFVYMFKNKIPLHLLLCDCP